MVVRFRWFFQVVVADCRGAVRNQFVLAVQCSSEASVVFALVDKGVGPPA